MLRLQHRTLIVLAFVLLTSAAQAHGRHRHYGGACDGFHRCRCGTTAARLAGLPYIFHGINLKQAVGWLSFARTGIRRGAVGYVRRGAPTGHVFTVVSYSGGSTATVEDDKGTYTRSIGNATFVSPGALRN